MIKKTIFCISILVFTLTIVTGGTASASATLTVSSSGDGTFVLHGTSVEDVASMDITITYDSASLTNPGIVAGGLISGALTAINTNIPGTIRMAIIRVTPINGSGLIATLTFGRKGASMGKINTLNAILSTLDGKSLPALAQIANPVDLTATASDQPVRDEKQQDINIPSTHAVASSGVQTAQTPAAVITGQQTAEGELMDNTSGKVDSNEAIEQTVESEAGVSPTEELSAADLTTEEAEPPAGTPEQIFEAQKSILDLFQEYAGEQTSQSFLSLFERGGAIWFSQEPPVVLTDGKTLVKVTFISEPGKENAQNIVATGARLRSIKKDPDYTNRWIAELLPEKGTYEASLTVPMEKLTIVLPLTVAPRLNIDLDESGTVDEADFALFLKKRHMLKALAADLNGDGWADYLDDYIFTANFIEQTKRGSAGVSSRK